MCEIPRLCAKLLAGVDNSAPSARLQLEAAAGWDLRVVMELCGQQNAFPYAALNGGTVF